MRKITCILSALVVCFACCACDFSKSQADNKPITDYPVTAFDVTIDKCPQKIVSLSPYVTQIITELGSDAQLTGVSDHCNTQRDVARVGTSLMPDVEAIAKLKPDAIFASTAISEKAKARLEKSGAVVFTVDSAERYSDLLKIYTQIANITSGKITGERNANNTFNRIDNQLKAISNADKKSKKVAVYFSEAILIPNTTFADELISFAGGHNIADTENLSDDEVKALKPDVILCDSKNADKLMQRFEGFTVAVFDIGVLDARASNMIDAVNALKTAINS